MIDSYGKLDFNNEFANHNTIVNYTTWTLIKEGLIDSYDIQKIYGIYIYISKRSFLSY